MQFLVVLAALVAVGSAQLVSPGRCRDEAVVQNFDVASYTGLWYETYRYNHENQPNGDCVTAEYTPNEFGNITVRNRMVALGVEVTIQGTADLANAESGEAKLLVHFPTGANSFSDYWVLSTDYSTYSLVYACNNLPENNKRVSSWILSRTPILSAEAVLAMNDALDSAQGLSWENYRQTSQTEASCRVN